VRMPVMLMRVLMFTASVMMSAGAFSFMLMFFHNKTSNLATVCENKLRTVEYCCIFHPLKHIFYSQFAMQTAGRRNHVLSFIRRSPLPPYSPT
jgi:hypothetical protein